MNKKNEMNTKRMSESGKDPHTHGHERYANVIRHAIMNIKEIQDNEVRYKN